MANWSKASVVYCDGASFSGNADAPVVAAGTGVPTAEVNRTLYFRGRRNLDAVIDDLKSKGMDKANMAVLGGCSAGGLGALVQCDHFASQLPGANKTRCIGDAGTFLNAESLTKFDGGKKTVMEMQFGNLVAFQNTSLSKACLASVNNTFPAACFFPENTLPTQKTPTFVRNSFYNYGGWETLPWNWHNVSREGHSLQYLECADTYSGVLFFCFFYLFKLTSCLDDRRVTYYAYALIFTRTNKLCLNSHTHTHTHTHTRTHARTRARALQVTQLYSWWGLAQPLRYTTLRNLLLGIV